MKDALDEVFLLSDRIIQDLVADIVVDIGALYKASEAVALLDMLWSFAHAAIREPIPHFPPPNPTDATHRSAQLR